MNLPSRLLRAARVGLFSAVVLALAASAPANDSLTWRKEKASVDADILTWDTVRVLERIAEATGWQVYLEPGARIKVSTKFKDRAPDKALDLLLGNLSRALLPGTNGGASRLLVFRNRQNDATQLIKAPGKQVKPIPNELIVTMKPGANLEDLAKKLGAKVKGRSAGMNAGRLEFDDADAANAARDALRDHEEVASVDVNYPVGEQPQVEGSANAALNLKLQPIKDGQGVIVGLIDSAVQRQGGSLDGFLMPTISVAGESQPPVDRPSHGTSMWETLLGGVSQANESGQGSRVRVLPVDVYGNSPTTSTFEVATGIYEAMRAGATVINLSLGSEGDTPFLYQVIREGRQAGRIFIASAGNTPVTTPTYPAAYSEVIAVTAGDSRGNLASYANRGSFVDMMAPGTTTITFNGQTWRVSGTSPAAAYVSGLIAGTADRSGRSPEQAAAAVQRSSQRVAPR